MLLQDDLDHALSGKLDFTGFIAFNKAYVDAPNPGLQLAGLGPIGLPLNAREAEVIKSRAKQAPFGMGERTVVDTSVRDTWEMDASSVSCTRQSQRHISSDHRFLSKIQIGTRSSRRLLEQFARP